MTIQFEKLILILVRITAFIVICPGFSFKGLPNIFKIGLSFSISLIVYFMVPDLTLGGNFYLLIPLAIKETLFGLSIGYITKLVFAAVEIAGDFIDFQVGFSMGQVFDPSMGVSSSNYGRLLNWLSISVFFMMNMHHYMIETLIKSFEMVPLNSLDLNQLGVSSIVSLFSHVFELGFNLAVPIIIVVLTTDIVLGVISRTVPQINVLMLGMPMKSMISFILFMLISSWLLNSIGKIVSFMPKFIEGFINSM
ncbi:flagellar biosynthetic protein FliR [Tissierella creatinophila]|uniref:Flagellar biosynthetic protein FliR n=1 Tax=Tissierella creatinophila DSM 6911 TaxID=1123403 RepID=A0A1U7M973_TISCR|nr:flagellar biosynthetic protein FliR [Tissierella creatinophila]OLS03759.1 flagellar biosynthetic protein FliR [Tissierella creatinophila DSM 6911]